MSGGPYGRGKAPERACMKIGAWPAEDRWIWQRACAPADLLDEESGARAGHRPISNRKAEKGYGRWLTYLAAAEPAALALAPADRITPERVRAFIESLRALDNSSATILARLQELGEVAKVMGRSGTGALSLRSPRRSGRGAGRRGTSAICNSRTSFSVSGSG